MNRGTRAAGAMTEEQRRLVNENIGLVAVHLRRRVGNLDKPRCDREWEDLFQEGCLGLIRAARTYRAERGIPFAAFAFARIHNAVSRALQTGSAMARIPAEPAAAQRMTVQQTLPGRCRIESAHGEGRHRPGDTRSDDPDEPHRETVGQRLRDKYERAVRTAVAAISRQKSVRGDRHEVVRILVEERLMMPCEESRRALRQIARDTHSSYSRVAQCEMRLRETIRETLEVDPEFRELQRHAKGTPSGTDEPIDDGLERRLARASADEFSARFRSAGAQERARMIEAYLGLSDGQLLAVLGTGVSRLPARKRERLFRMLGTKGSETLGRHRGSKPRP